jgi:hypothetical protein
VFTVLELHI